MISVIIPAYNSAATIGRAIQSILAPYNDDVEVIVVDDGSEDTTKQVVTKYGDRIRYVYQQNQGVSCARNRGIEISQGDWLAFLDADDEFLPHKLSMQRQVMKRNPDLMWCGGNYIVTDGVRRQPRFDLASINKATKGRERFEDFFAEAGTLKRLSTPAMLIHRTLFQELGGFEPGRQIGEDMDMWWRIAHRYPSLGYVAYPLATVHLDVSDNQSRARRLRDKSGEDIRELTARHLELARNAGNLESFEPYVAKEIQSRLLAMLFHGFYIEAQETVAQFPKLFPQHYKFLTRTITAFPKTSSSLIYNAALLARKLGLERQINRRWLDRKEPNPPRD